MKAFFIICFTLLSVSLSAEILEFDKSFSYKRVEFTRDMNCGSDFYENLDKFLFVKDGGGILKIDECLDYKGRNILFSSRNKYFFVYLNRDSSEWNQSSNKIEIYRKRFKTNKDCRKYRKELLNNKISVENIFEMSTYDKDDYERFRRK